MWLDSHCHITSGKFDEDRADVLQRAREAGVERLIVIGSGYGIAGNAAALELASAHDDVHAAVGVHPHEAAELDDAARTKLREWLRHPEVVALGECGLDYHYMNSPRDVQRSVFAEQLALAREYELPVTIHVRGDDPDAYGELLDIWRGEGGDALRGLLHCYTGSLDFARRAVDLGFLVSFSGILTFKRADALRDVARTLPLDRLMIETDAPFLAPQSHRGRRNEPAWVGEVGETLADLHGVPAPEMARITSDNARRFFGIGGGGEA